MCIMCMKHNFVYASNWLRISFIILIQMWLCNLHVLYFGLIHIISTIDMGGCDIILGVEWLRTLGLVTMDFKEFSIIFSEEGNINHIKGITSSSPKIISSHYMEKLLKKGKSCIIAQFNSI